MPLSSCGSGTVPRGDARCDPVMVPKFATVPAPMMEDAEEVGGDDCGRIARGTVDHRAAGGEADPGCSRRRWWRCCGCCRAAPLRRRRRPPGLRRPARQPPGLVSRRGDSRGRGIGRCRPRGARVPGRRGESHRRSITPASSELRRRIERRLPGHGDVPDSGDGGGALQDGGGLQAGRSARRKGARHLAPNIILQVGEL